MSAKKSLGIAIAALLAATGLFLGLKGRGDRSQTPDERAKDEVRNLRSPRKPSEGQAGKSFLAADRKQRTVSQYLDELASPGTDLHSNRAVDLIREASETLKGAELTRFLDELAAGEQYRPIADYAVRIVVPALVGGRIDASEFQTWIASHADLAFKDSLLEAAARAYAESSKPGFQGFMTAFPAQADQHLLLSRYGAALAATNPSEAIQALRTIGNGTLDPAILGEILRSAPEQTDFATLAGKLDDPANERRLQDRRTLLTRWAEFKPEEAAAYASAQSAEDPTLVGTVVKQWGQTSARKAAEWTSSQPSSPARDLAIEGVVSLYAKSNPQAAWDLAGGIGDEHARYRALAGVHAEWKKFRPEDAAQAWKTVKAPEPVKPPAPKS